MSTDSSTSSGEQKTGVVEVRVTEVFGRKRIYPVNALAQDFLKLVGGKTFNEQQIHLIKHMGFEVEVVPEKIGV